MRKPIAAGIATIAALAISSASPSAWAQKPDASPDSHTDVPRLAAGATLLSLGASATLGGGVAYTVLGARTAPCAEAVCIDPDASAKKASLVTMLLGGAGMAAGIPLIITSFSSKRTDGKSERRKEIASLPLLRVGAGSASLTWSF